MTASHPPTPTLPQGVQVFERGWLSANNILCADRADPERTHTALIDTGYCTHSAQTLALVTQALSGRPLDCIVNTHLHSDHCGGNAALQAAYPEAHTLIPPGHAPRVATWDARALSYELTGQDCPRFTFTATLQPGSTVRLGAHTWQIHAAPGHDPHSVVLFEPRSRTLISADALWENGFGVVFPELEGLNAFDDVAATLDVIEALEPRTVIPGHGKVFTYTPQHLAAARSRLDYFVQNPAKHRRYAAKVLVTYYMLAQQRQRRADLLAWCAAVPYLQTLGQAALATSNSPPDTPPDTPSTSSDTRHRSQSQSQSFTHWCQTLIDELIKAGNLRTTKAPLQTSETQPTETWLTAT